jgi:hypothetical protein
MTPSGERGKRRFTANDSGNGPATSVPPILSAKQDNTEDELQKPYRPVVLSEGDEFTPGGGAVERSDEDDGETVAAIYKIFRQKLRGLRSLPRWARPAALRAVREWLAVAMNDLREKRAYRRHARYMDRQRRRFQSPNLGGQ